MVRESIFWTAEAHEHKESTRGEAVDFPNRGEGVQTALAREATPEAFENAANE